MIEVGEGIRTQLEVVSGRLFEIKCGENTAELYSVFTRKRFSEAVRISPPPFFLESPDGAGVCARSEAPTHGSVTLKPRSHQNGAGPGSPH